MNNPVELKRISDMIEEVKGDSSITVREISVIGYASPEGAFTFNKELSEGRAKALVDYLLPRFSSRRNCIRWNMAARTGRVCAKWLQSPICRTRMASLTS